jgi:O-antigen/teichoic acid export membrane protein
MTWSRWHEQPPRPWPAQPAAEVATHEPWLRASAGLLMLYGSRTAGVLVSLVFVPRYAQLLGSHDFGVAALILSAQALLLMLDLGMAALTSRDIAADPSDESAGRSWRRAEMLLTVLFASLLLPGLAVTWALGYSAELALCAAILFWAVTLQNLAQAAMIARGDVQRAAAIQAAGVLLRAALTVGLLTWIEASLRIFVIGQMAGALAHLAVNRRVGQPETCRLTPTTKRDLAEIARRGLPLFLVGVAGAAALHLDKILIGSFVGPTALTPYYLATTFCLAPIGLLAAPVVQFFQPPIIRALASNDDTELRRRTRQLTIALLLTVLLPTLAIWIGRLPLISWWLGDPKLGVLVAGLSAPLLPAAAIGAVGNVPLALVTARADFRFQAQLSAVLSALTLLAVAAAASQGRLMAVAWLYLAYYLGATVGLWLRATSHPTTARAAKDSAALALAGVVLVGLPAAILATSA